MNDAIAKVIKALKGFKGLFIAAAIVIIIILGLFAYSGLWPPLVVVESESMQHSDTTSYIGVIDTGDMVVPKKISSLSDVKTYVSSLNDGYQTYGDYGDVVIYDRDGSVLATPVIHRAMVELVFNGTSYSFDIPSLANVPLDRWSVAGQHSGIWYNLTSTLEIYHVGYRDQTVTISLSSLLSYYKSNGIVPHGGLITKGDHNLLYDQSPLANIAHQPVIAAWVVGEARGEIPWFGLIKLWAGGSMPAQTPENSKTDLILTIIAIIAIPITLDITEYMLRRRGIDMWGKIRSVLRMKPKKPEEEKQNKPKQKKNNKKKK
ncbi:MAG: S26 family signal peptidase [Methanomassiliicoccales archaeon]